MAPAVIAAMWAFALAVFSRLPARVPTHWDVHGEVDGWMNRFPGAFLLPLTAMALVTLLWWVLPRVDPRRANFDRFGGEVNLFGNALTLFFAVLEVVTIGVALGWPVDVSSVLMAALGLLFIILGNYLPRLRSNWWMGIRTPWTMDSERVWRDTHRVGGRAFVAAGVVTLVAALLPATSRAWVSGVALAGAALVPVVYSYLAWRRDHSGRAA
ncbi:MAG TPA: SdpI family protein [Longimicrobium sp.]|nr:SdpI family protein [Longimicrobium sp.]